MVNKITKLLVLMVVAVIITGGLVGCKEKSEHPVGDQPSKEVPAQEAPADEHPSADHPG